MKICHEGSNDNKNTGHFTPYVEQRDMGGGARSQQGQFSPNLLGAFLLYKARRTIALWTIGFTSNQPPYKEPVF